ncbi:MAG: gamma-glutamyltransferase [Actinobacteria bacterium]|nr:gamma-glutamyltransferase [Actinomycetota bacterium]
MTAAIATSDPRATAAGAELLAAGANAVDAAVAAALVLYVVEPQQCGLGGDAFLIHVPPGQPPVGLDGSGAVPLGLDDAALAAAGLDTVPARGAGTATVPGAYRLLEDAAARFGTRSMAQLAAHAIALADDGFAVRPTLAIAAERAAAEIVDDPVLGPLYVPGGRPVAEGDVVRNPVVAGCLAALCEHGSGLLYGGELGRAVVESMRAAGGYLSEDDLARHVTLPAELISTEFRGSTIWELPPPTQGIAVLHALDSITADTDRVESADDWARVIEHMRAAMAAAGFDLAQIGARPAPPSQGDTTYIATVDREGGAASLITSLFGDFGSHFGVPALGGAIGNRATMLRALRRPMTPGAKPPHTTIPAAVTRDGALQYVLGVAGGFMQPQAQVQVLVHLLERGLAPQDAIDEPRFRIGFGGTLSLESGHPLCDRMPDAAARPPGPEGFGAAQVVAGPLAAGGVAAGADHRRGGVARVVS